MKLRTVSLLLLLALVPSVRAQQANLTTPETATLLSVASFTVDRTKASVIVEYQAPDTTVRKVREYTTSSPAELLSFVTALTTVRATETGGMGRKLNFRILGWLFDNSKIRDDSNAVIPTTVAP